MNTEIGLRTSFEKRAAHTPRIFRVVIDRLFSKKSEPASLRFLRVLVWSFVGASVAPLIIIAVVLYRPS